MINEIISDKKTWLIKCLMVLYDIVFANLAYGFALWLRFDFRFSQIPANYFYGWLYFVPIFAVLVIIVFSCFRLYNSVWRYVSYVEMIKTLAGCIILGALQIIGTLIITCRLPISVYVMGFMVMFVFLMGIRVSYRAARVVYRSIVKRENLERVLIVGAGEAGRILLREIRLQNPIKSQVICFADDAKGKQNKVIDGVKVKGRTKDVPTLVNELDIDRIIIALPSASNKRIREIYEALKVAKCELNIVPRKTVTDNIVDLKEIKKFSMEDFLGRDEIIIDSTEVGMILEGKNVMITGGGGSIGSELVRQVAAYNPETLIIFDNYENGAYEIQQEIKRKFPYLNLKVIIGSVSNEEMVSSIIHDNKPDIIYHAAAHKHVPLMETVPWEAVTNNVLGTYYTAKAAAQAGCSRFILISTDKAVNPTNIMGASKRMCEMVIKAMNDRYETEFAAVRFGNVLGSNGSVIPLFRKQIEEGGPVTVTHPEVTRFFMTIPEAVSLVLQAGAFAKGGELFFLDMGESVKIDELARNIIRMAGYIPDVDIKVEYTGLRPGEKLYEELMMNTENLEKTQNKLIYIGGQNEVPEGFMNEITALEGISFRDSEKIVDMVKRTVKTYIPKAENTGKTKINVLK